MVLSKTRTAMHDKLRQYKTTDALQAMRIILRISFGSTEGEIMVETDAVQVRHNMLEEALTLPR